MSTEVKSKPIPAVYYQVEKRLEAFTGEILAEPWKRDSDDAMRCHAFNATMNRCVALYNEIILVGEQICGWMLQQDSGTYDANECYRLLDSLTKRWLGHCEFLELQIASFQAKGFVIELVEEFRKQHGEAKWILADPAVLFDHSKFHELERQAIEDLRAGRCEEWE